MCFRRHLWRTRQKYDKSTEMRSYIRRNISRFFWRKDHFEGRRVYSIFKIEYEVGKYKVCATEDLWHFLLAAYILGFAEMLDPGFIGHYKFQFAQVVYYDDRIQTSCFRRRNPPGKDNKYGDAINWECLLYNVPNEEDLYFIRNSLRGIWMVRSYHRSTMTRRTVLKRFRRKVIQVNFFIQKKKKPPVKATFH